MAREARRVPIEFDWPLNKTWTGYLLPEWLQEKPCDHCEHGWSPEYEALQAKWYGLVEFDPAETGSTPWTADHPEIRERAERNIANAPQYYRYGVQTEAERLAALFNSWQHHLSWEDVDTLIKEGRLPAGSTAKEVNRDSITLGKRGHDSLNAYYVIKARLAKNGLPAECGHCKGHGSVERWHGQRAEAEAWEPVEPPTGEGWQMWETTSEGSPVSPVFATADDLAAYCAEHVGVFGRSMATKERWLKIINRDDLGMVEIAPGVMVL